VAAWHGLPRGAQEEHLSQWVGVASRAAATALDADQPETAVELLEQGRGVLWSQLLDSRTDVAALAEAAPELAQRLQAVRAGLDRAASLVAQAAAASEPA
jgi:hypothetical protein